MRGARRRVSQPSKSSSGEEPPRNAQMGIADMAIGVIATNDEAIPFYERRGAVPLLTQFIQRVGPNHKGAPSTD